MIRRAGLALAASFVLLALLLGGLIAFRATIAEIVLKDRLAARGLPAPDLTVAELGLRGARITGIRLGSGREIAVRRLDVAYRPSDLLAGRIDGLAVDGLVLQLDLLGPGPPLGSLQALLSGDGGARAGAPAVPRITLHDSRIEAQTPLGAAIAEIEGEIAPADQDAAAAALSFAIDGEAGRLTGGLDLSARPDGTLTGKLTVTDGTFALPGAEVGGLTGAAEFIVKDGVPEALNAAFSLRQVSLPQAEFRTAEIRVETKGATMSAAADLDFADGRASAKLRARLDDYRTASNAELTLEAEVSAGAGLWQVLALPGPEKGRISAGLNAAGRLPALRDLAGRSGLALLAGVELRGELVLNLDELVYPDRAVIPAGHLAAQVSLTEGDVEITLSRDGRIRASEVSPGWLTDLGLPAEVTALMKDGVEMVLPAGESPASRLQLTPGAEGAELVLTILARLSAPNGARAEAFADGRLALSEDFRLSSLSFDVLEVRAQALPLRMARVERAELAGVLDGAPARLEGGFELTLDLANLAVGPLSAAGAQMKVSAALATEGAKLSLRLRERGSLRVDGLRFGDMAELDAPLRLAIAGGATTLERDPAQGLSLRHRVTLEPGGIQVRLRPSAEAPIPISLHPGRLRLEGGLSPGAPYRGLARMEGGRARLPDQKIALEDLTAVLRFGGADGEMLADFAAGALKHTRDPPLLAPLGLAGKLRLAEGKLKFSAAGTQAGGAGLFTLAGRHRIDAGRGELRFELAPLSFAPGGLQPKDIFPALAELRNVAGQAEANARLTWGPGDPKGSAAVTLSAVSFESDGADVEGLNLDLALDRLWPPGSPPGQRLSIRKFDPGTAIADIAALFHIEPGEPPRVVIEDGGAFMSGGRFWLGETRIDPAAQRHDVTLRIDDLDLAQALNFLEVPGLSASGRLSGAIPITLIGETVAIKAGRLDAQEPGILRYRSENAARLLSGGGESLDLMLRALENFHYDELSLTIEKTAKGDSQLILSLLGKNPDVLEGHPFRFNINIEGNTDSMLAALGQAYRLSNRLLRRAWQIGE